MISGEVSFDVIRRSIFVTGARNDVGILSYELRGFFSLIIKYWSFFFSMKTVESYIFFVGEIILPFVMYVFKISSHEEL